MARAAAFASLIVLTAVVLVLLIPALLIGGVVFVLLSFYVAVRTRFARWSRGREMEAGRENVRVVRRDDPGPR